MTATVNVWPPIGQAVPIPTAAGAPCPVGGAAVAQTGYIIGLIASGRLLTSDPLSGGDATEINLLSFAGPVVCPRYFGAVGDGIAEDTAALSRCFSSGFKSFDLEGLTYKVAIPYGSYLAKWASKTGITINGHGATFVDTTSHDNGGAQEALFSQLFWFDACTNVRVQDVGYTGTPLSSPSTLIGYNGASFVRLTSGTSDVTIVGKVSHARHGVHTGDYGDPSLGGCKNVRAKISAYYVGYPWASYLCDDFDVDVSSEVNHRAVYIAGALGFNVKARFKGQYLAPIQVLLTNTLSAGTTVAPSAAVGCRSGRVTAVDMGSPFTSGNSWCAGISSQWALPVDYADIDASFYVKSTDSIATNLGGFIVSPSGNLLHPSTRFRNLTVEGTIDRSEQTVAGNTSGEIVMNIENVDHTFPIADNITFRKCVLRKGSGSGGPGVILNAPGLNGNLTLDDCDFREHQVAVKTNTTTAKYRGHKSKVLVHANDSGSLFPYTYIDSEIGSALGTPSVATLINTMVAGQPALASSGTGITAATGGAAVQGGCPLAAHFNVVATVTAENDVATLMDAASACDRPVWIVNGGAHTLKLYPKSGQDLSKGTDTALYMAPGSRACFMPTSSTAWSLLTFRPKESASQITASTTQTQGQQRLVARQNDVSTVANANDTVTFLKAEAEAGHIWLTNFGANTMKVYPEVGDNLGPGTNVAITLASGVTACFSAISATFWRRLV